MLRRQNAPSNLGYEPKVNSATVLLFLGAARVALLGFLIVLITFRVVYAVVWFAFHWLLPHSHETRLLISAENESSRIAETN
jgi:hypothetical protein